LGARGRERIWTLLTRAGRADDGKALPGADPVIERALILKAVGARRHRLGPWAEDGEDALAEVVSFAHAFRGLWRATLAARTTLFPGDPIRQAKVLETLDPLKKAAAMARGDIDPLYAWQQHGVSREDAPAEAKAAEDIYAPLPDLD